MENQLKEICERVFGRLPDEVLHPGGASRRTVLVRIGSARYAIARRSSPSRAALEASALRHLSGTGRTPALVHCEGRYVIQTAVAGERLSTVLDRVDRDEAASWITRAARSLAHLQQVAAQSPLMAHLPVIGARDGWAADLAAAPLRLAERLDLPAPRYDRDAAERMLTVPTVQPVKWDARPGNALCTPQGQVVWIDWEHCGLRRATDDLAWLLADEWCPQHLDLEATLVGQFTGGTPEHFGTMALLHAVIRVDLIVSHLGAGPWWDRRHCLDLDKVGVTPRELSLQLMKISRWSATLDWANGLFELADGIHRKKLGNTAVWGVGPN
ncbi:aminoglycoside phosphotransferase family protein [Tropicibacter alexandrii]|uniref:aminoglycoside phosphotransferase family protein n=1 Tax=Tropicibacter alexandrii TaxID=2267683 RepID=UPI000EF52E40|nr:aminoglycoside phosphotransferase family protein [Tropicibacter alexandrii]